jgi:hypothetical protein
MPAHPLTDFAVRQAVEQATSVHLGRPWRSKDFVDLDDLASHRSGIFRGESISVFAKLATDPLGRERFVAELQGLTLIHERSGVTRPTPVGSGAWYGNTDQSNLLRDRHNGVSEEQRRVGSGHSRSPPHRGPPNFMTAHEFKSKTSMDPCFLAPWRENCSDSITPCTPRTPPSYPTALRRTTSRD